MSLFCIISALRCKSISVQLTFSCTSCKKKIEASPIEHICPSCGGLLWYQPSEQQLREGFEDHTEKSTFWDYVFSFPHLSKNFIVTLGEGGTPCKKSKKIHKILGLNHLYFKDETHNPTNSFKDRAAALLISHARSLEYEKVVCASNGNQGASIASYAALEGMECINIIPEDIDIGKRSQMVIYNSKIIERGKTVDEAIKEASKEEYKGIFYQATPELNPLTLEAQKTIAFEIYESIGRPDAILCPMGSGGLLVSIYKGFKELKSIDLIENLPKIVGIQSTTCSPIVNDFLQKKGKKPEKKEEIIESKATSILVKNPRYRALALKAIDETEGFAIAIEESLMLTSAEELARNEGILAEPASALSLAAISILTEKGEIQKDDKIVAIITGSGLKTPYVMEALTAKAKTAVMGGILTTKMKILNQISQVSDRGINGTRLNEIISNISLPAIYQHLRELESKNLISRKKEGKAVLYFITKKGKKVLDALEILITLL